MNRETTQDPPAVTAGSDAEALFAAEQANALEIIGRYRIPLEDAEDLLQNLFVQCFLRWRELKTPRAWFYSRLRYDCLYYYRRRRTRQTEMLTEGLKALPLTSPAAPSLQDLEIAFDTVVKRLQKDCRETLILRYRRGFQAGEIAAVLGLSATAAYRTLERCLNAFRRQALTK